MSLPDTQSRALSFEFTNERIERLVAVAAHFDIRVVRQDEHFTELSILDNGVGRSCTVPTSRAHLRILTELCEKTVRWVYFHDGMHCAHSLLSLPDSRLMRLAELYKERGGRFPFAQDDPADESP